MTAIGQSVIERLLSATSLRGRCWPVSDLWRRGPTGRFPRGQLHLGLLGYLERVVNINSEIAHRAFELGMTE